MSRRNSISTLFGLPKPLLDAAPDELQAHTHAGYALLELYDAIREQKRVMRDASSTVEEVKCAKERVDALRGPSGRLEQAKYNAYMSATSALLKVKSERLRGFAVHWLTVQDVSHVHDTPEDERVRESAPCIFLHNGKGSL